MFLTLCIMNDHPAHILYIYYTFIIVYYIHQLCYYKPLNIAPGTGVLGLCALLKGSARPTCSGIRTSKPSVTPLDHSCALQWSSEMNVFRCYFVLNMPYISVENSLKSWDPNWSLFPVDLLIDSSGLQRDHDPVSVFKSDLYSMCTELHIMSMWITLCVCMR